MEINQWYTSTNRQMCTTMSGGQDIVRSDRVAAKLRLVRGAIITPATTSSPSFPPHQGLASTKQPLTPRVPIDCGSQDQRKQESWRVHKPLTQESLFPVLTAYCHRPGALHPLHPSLTSYTECPTPSGPSPCTSPHQSPHSARPLTSSPSPCTSPHQSPHSTRPPASEPHRPVGT